MGLISSGKISSPLSKIIWITVGWTFVALFKFFIGYSTIIDSKFQCSFAELDFGLYLKSTLIASVAVGIIGGSIIVFVWEKWLRTKSYGWVLTSIFLSYVLIYFIVSLISSLFFHMGL